MVHGQTKLKSAVSVSSVMQPDVLALYDSITNRTTPIRRLAINFCDVSDEDEQDYDLFTDWAAVDREPEEAASVAPGDIRAVALAVPASVWAARACVADRGLRCGGRNRRIGECSGYTCFPP